MSIHILSYFVYFLACVGSSHATFMRRQQPVTAATFRDGISVGNVNSPQLIETSGIAASRMHPGVIYANNRHEKNPKIYALNETNAELIAVLSIGGGAHQQNWEDIAVGPCPGGSAGSCIYIADTGIVPHGHPANIIYRVQEPTQISNQTLSVESTLKFSWIVPECQTLMVDPTGHLYVISTVRGGNGKIAHLPSTHWGQPNAITINSMATVGITTQHHDPRGGDISPNGADVIVKTVNHVYYWHVSNYDYVNTLSRKPIQLPIHKELHQDEGGAAICWNSNGDGYYTLGEGSREPLYSYSKNPNAGLVG